MSGRLHACISVAKCNLIFPRCIHPHTGDEGEGGGNVSRQCRAVWTGGGEPEGS